MKLSVVAGLIVGVHIVVIGSVTLQGCAVLNGDKTASPAKETPEPPPAPVMPPTAEVAPVTPAQPIIFTEVKPPAPVKPAPVAGAANIYVVKKGDVLSTIARAHGVKTAELKELNHLTDANKIRLGQKLILPDYAKPSTSQPTAASTTPATAAAPASAAAVTAPGGTYVVKSGDALSKIAKKHSVTIKALMEANQIKDANKIRIGQKLTIPAATAAKAAAPAAPAPAPEKKDWVAPLPQTTAPVAAPAVTPAAPADPATPPVVEPAAPAALDADAAAQDGMLDYTVQIGDTVDSIARLFVVSREDILRVNNLSADSDVKLGQVIRIPPSSQP